MIVSIHSTVSVAGLEVLLPSLLFATHLYSPVSVLLRFVIFSCAPS